MTATPSSHSPAATLRALPAPPRASRSRKAPAITRGSGSQIGTLQGIIPLEEKIIGRLQQRLDSGNGDPAVIIEAMKEAQQTVDRARKTIGRLNDLHNWATKHITNLSQRRIGHVLYADPIGPSSKAPSAHTVDWAAVLLNQEAFDAGFTGNKVYIGMSLLPLCPTIPLC